MQKYFFKITNRLLRDKMCIC